MSEIAKITALDGVTYDIKDALARQTIPYGQVDTTSTSTAYTATVPGITELRDGTCMLLRNAKVTSASGFTININGLGAKPCYSNMATGNPVTPTDPTRDTTIFNINYTMLFVYSEDVVSGGGWICYRGYDANTNTIGYQLRTNSSSKKMSDITYGYRIFFESADGTLWVPANTSSSTNATASRTVNQRAINPFGEIVYYGATASVSAGSTPSVAVLWQEYALTFGYSFNRTGAALVLPYPKPIYIKCAPQANGSAIIDADTPYVTALPSSNDGKIYIYLGRTYSATAVEMVMCHPVYYHDGTGIRLWTGKTIPTKTSELTNDSGFITGYTETDPIFSSSAASEITSTDISNWNNKSDFSGSYNDLSNKPSIPSVSATQLLSTGTKIGSVTVNSTTTDFYAPTSGGITTETDPVFAASAAHGITSTDISNWNNKSDFNGSYDDLTDKPSIPSKTSDLTNDSGFVTTDNKVEQNIPTASSYSYWRPLLVGAASASSESGSYSTTTDKAYGFTNVRVQPSSGTIKATTFKGNLTGNVTGDVTGTASGNLTSNSTLNPAKLSGVTANTTNFLRSDGTWAKPTIGNVTGKQHGIMEMLNPFDPGQGKIYIDRLENAFYFLDKRYSVTGYIEDGEGNQTALTTAQIATMFDMSEVDSKWPAAGKKAVITMDFTGASGTGIYPNYPYGFLCIDFYYTSGPESVSARVYGKHTGTTPYWADLTVTDVSNGTAQLRYIAAQGVMYNMMKLEVTIQAKSDKNASMSDISYYLSRANYSKDMPYFSKLKAEKFYYSPTAPDYLLSDGRSVATALNGIPSSYVTSVNGNTGAVTIPDEIHIGTTTPTDSGVDVWIDTGSSGTLQNVVCSVNGISPTSSGNVDLIPGDRPTYYIDGTNGSDSNDGSQSRPFATINKALDLIKEYKIQNIYPAIVYIAGGTYDEFLDLRRLPLEFNINLQGDVTISGILCVHSVCFINGDSDGGHKLTVQYSSNVTYPWGKMLIYVSQGSTFDVKSGSSGSVEFKTTDNGVIGIWVGRESNFYIQKAVFTNTTNTFAYPITIENTEAKIGSIVSSGTNIGRIRESGTLLIGDINGGVSYTGTTVDATSRIIFKPVKSVCSKTPDANGDVALVSSDVGAMGAWTLLWSNANPTSSFAAQTVAIDLSGYDFVAIKFLADTASGSILYNKMQIRVVPVGDGGWAEHLLTAGTGWPTDVYNGLRPFETSSSGVTFSACTERGSTHNNTEVPQEIYGIKGVITAIS